MLPHTQELDPTLIVTFGEQPSSSSFDAFIRNQVTVEYNHRLAGAIRKIVYYEADRESLDREVDDDLFLCSMSLSPESISTIHAMRE